MPKASVYLVYDNSYQVLGVASSDKAAHTKFADQAVFVVGPVELDTPVDWGTVREDRYGVDFGPVADYANMNDGVPLQLELGFYESLGHPTH